MRNPPALRFWFSISIRDTTSVSLEVDDFPSLNRGLNLAKLIYSEPERVSRSGIGHASECFGGKRRYSAVAPGALPATECLADVVARLLPYFYDVIAPKLLAGSTILVVAHGNSLRAMVKHLEDITDSDIAALEIPTGVPRVSRSSRVFWPERKRYIAPHHDTIHRALTRVDTQALDRAIGAWLHEQTGCRRQPRRAQVAIALDGKAARGSLREDGRPLHLLSAMVHGDGIVIGQEEVDRKSNEITALRPLLEPLDIEGALLTADALHCQRDDARYIVSDKAGRLPSAAERKPAQAPRRGQGDRPERLFRRAPRQLPWPRAYRTPLCARRRRSPRASTSPSLLRWSLSTVSGQTSMT